jgi:hypothetical protein
VKTEARFDAEIDHTLVEVKSGLNAVRNLRAGLLDLAYALQGHPNHRGLLVLADTNISEGRLQDEWRLAAETLRPDVIARLSLLSFEEGHFRGYPNLPPQSFLARVGEIVRGETSRAGRQLPRPDYASEILKILIRAWFLKSGSMTTTRLQKIAGCAYPTVAKTLDKLSPYLRRNSDRSFGLARFPKDAWSTMLMRGDDLRQTVRFADRSGQPRSPDTLVRRLTKLGRSDVALGGVFGARNHYPNLDLLGTPRVDLTVHCPGNRLDLGFVSRIDPGLMPANSNDASPVLVVHVLRRQEPFFTLALEGGFFADPVECLLDLHEARLESQAEEFFNAFAPKPLQ